LFPSFEQVRIKISERRGLYEISDMSGAVSSVLSHGKEGKALETALKSSAKKYRVELRGGELWNGGIEAQWLPAAIFALSNASAEAAQRALHDEEVTASEVLIMEMDRSLVAAHEDIVALQKDFVVKRNFHSKGKSGKSWRFDFAVLAKQPILIKSVSPHGNSVNANFVAFSDIPEESENKKFCVYSREPSMDDMRLLNQVANVVPVGALRARVANAALH
jgi:hypothetical protein